MLRASLRSSLSMNLNHEADGKGPAGARARIRIRIRMGAGTHPVYPGTTWPCHPGYTTLRVSMVPPVMAPASGLKECYGL